MIKTTVLLGLLLVTHVATAAERPLAQLIDPADDDVGDGTLEYSMGEQLRRGDLDLRSLNVSRDEDGYWLVATFGGPIRSTWWVLPNSRDLYSRQARSELPFNFNLDIYIDTDRKPGSGQTFTLPGRNVRIDSRYAWERAIILSPLPKSARAQLIDKLTRNFPDRPAGEAAASVDSNMHFVSIRRIKENSVAIHVPRHFMGDTDGSDWAVTAFVTGASPVMTDDNLGVLQPGADHPVAGQALPAPIIDALLPTAELQFRLLRQGTPLTGLSWGVNTANEVELEGGAQSFRARLKSLKELLDQRLINEADYHAKRQRILDEL